MQVSTPTTAAVSSSHSSERPGTTEHLGKHRQYWRDIILGCNDGLVSTFLLVVGVAGGGLSSKDILLTGIAGALAGAVSMSAGEFVATKSQNEVMNGELALEQSHVRYHRQEELGELSELFEMIGIQDEDEALKHDLLEFYDQNPEALLKIMKALEFGVVDEEQRSPIMAGVTSGGLFILASLPSVIPFAATSDPTSGLIIAACCTVAALMVVGMIKTWATRGDCKSAALENLIIASAGGALAYGVGVMFEKIID